MSDTNLEDIQERLQAKFNEEGDSLAGTKKRTIVFWYDSKKSYEDVIDQLELTCKGKEVKILKVESYFKTKYILEHEDQESNYLLYLTEQPAKPEENWLEDVRLYSANFKADKLAMIMDECKILGGANRSQGELYDDLINYEDFFNKARKEKFIRLYNTLSESERDIPENLYLCMLAACAKAPSYDFKLTVFLLIAGELDGNNEGWKAVQNSGLEPIFWNLTTKYYGYLSEEKSLKNLWYRILFGAMYYKAPKLKFWNEKKHRDYIFMKATDGREIGSFIDPLRASASVDEWINRNDCKDNFVSLCAEFLENRKIGYESFKEDFEDISEFKNLNIIKQFEEFIIKHLKEELKSHKIDNVKDFIDYRKNTSKWYPDFENEYQLIYYCGLLNELIQTIELKEENSDTMWKHYTTKYYLVDQYYRKALFNYKNLDEPSKNSFKEILEYNNNIYAKWVEDLNDRRYRILESEGYQEDWNKGSLPKQRNFWNDYIVQNCKPVGKYEKLLVIISDAFRYEAAMELKERLPLGNTCEVSIDSVFGCIPSFTQLGMASLLPHKELSFHDSEKGRNIDSGDKSTAGLDARNTILQSESDSNIAIVRKDFDKLKQDEQWALLKDKKIVYVYHNIIDESANADEDNVPNETERCIDELNKIAFKFSYSPFNFSKIFITADHGHLYQMKDLENTDKTRRTLSADQDKSRFAVGKTEKLEADKKNHAFNDLIVHLDYIGETNLSVSTPWADKRYKKPGDYSKFDHGGATLQELVVPVIDYSYKGKVKDLISYAKIVINTVPSSVTTNTFKLVVSQVEEVNDKVIPGEYKIVVRKASTKDIISREIIFNADKKNSLPSERQTEILVDLLPVNISDKEICEIHIEATNPEKNNYEQDYLLKVSIGISNEFNF